MTLLSNEPATPEQLRTLREEVRAFLRKRRDEGAFKPDCDAWVAGWNRPFSQELSARGWVGMTIPERYGGGGRTHLERLVVTEELLAAGAPVAAHWVTERQIAPMLLASGTEEQRERFLPRIAAAELAFALGMSEPDSGSDLASIRTKATRTDSGWILTGQKIWTTSALRSEFILVLCRTGLEEERNAGLSQLIVDLGAPGVEIRGIPAPMGDEEFSEVFFEEVFVPDADLLGVAGEGWRQVTAELGYERGGPDRFMSNLPLLSEFVRTTEPDRESEAVIGELIARLTALRALATGVVEAGEAGREFSRAAALGKDAGGVYEQDMVEILRRLGIAWDNESLIALMNRAMVNGPTVTLRGGTTEILRGITAKGLVGK